MEADITTMGNARWNEIRGEVQKKWGRLTGSDLDTIQGEVTRLVGLIEDKYGYTTQRARQEVDSFLRKRGMTASDVQMVAENALADVKRSADRYPWAFAVAGVLLALIVVGLIWKPFSR